MLQSCNNNFIGMGVWEEAHARRGWLELLGEIGECRRGPPQQVAVRVGAVPSGRHAPLVGVAPTCILARTHSMLLSTKHASLDPKRS